MKDGTPITILLITQFLNLIEESGATKLEACSALAATSALLSSLDEQQPSIR
jgi:hypothetical protein